MYIKVLPTFTYLHMLLYAYIYVYIYVYIQEERGFRVAVGLKGL